MMLLPKNKKHSFKKIRILLRADKILNNYQFLLQIVENHRKASIGFLEDKKIMMKLKIKMLIYLLLFSNLNKNHHIIDLCIVILKAKLNYLLIKILFKETRILI